MDISDKTFYTCIDNLIPEEQQVFLQKYLIENKRFNWHLHLSTITKDDLKEYNHLNINENIQFVHSFVYYDKHEETSEIGSSFYNNIEPVIKTFGEKYNYKKLKVIRAKANLQTQSSNVIKDSHCGPHRDLPFPHYVLLYYVNDSDGDTFLFDKNYNIIDRITPKRGRALFFNGDILHASSLPVESKYRAVINIDMDILNND